MKNRGQQEGRSSSNVTLSSNGGIGAIRNTNFVLTRTNTVRFEEGGHTSQRMGCPWINDWGVLWGETDADKANANVSKIEVVNDDVGAAMVSSWETNRQRASISSLDKWLSGKDADVGAAGLVGMEVTKCALGLYPPKWPPPLSGIHLSNTDVEGDPRDVRVSPNTGL